MHLRFRSPAILIAFLVALAPGPSPAEQHRLVPALTSSAVSDQPEWHSNGADLIEFNAPGAALAVSPVCAPSCGTFALANNASGVITGYFTDKYVVPHGFVRWPGGHITVFDAPGAGLGHGLNEGTAAYSINGLGVVAGQYEDSAFVYHAFIRNPDGKFTTFNAPGAGTNSHGGKLFVGTEAFSNNDAGTTAGIYADANGAVHGFVRPTSGAITAFDPVNSVYTFVCEETCLNNKGAITGTFVDASGLYHGFMREPGGKITPFDVPKAGGGTYPITFPASINNGGTITGYVVDASEKAHGFVRAADGAFTIFDVPGAGTGVGQGTVAFSINAYGTVTGEFLDSSGSMHGFSRSTRGTLVTFDAPGAGTKPRQGTRPSTNNLLASVTGWFVDGTGLGHGFIWIPKVAW